jgi:hypothetical protein
MSDNAQLFTGVHDTPAYTRLFNRSTRVWVAAPVVLGGVSTPVLAAVNLDSGNARSIVIIGVLITAVLTGLGALVPRSRPNMAFRAKAHRASIRPKLQSSTDTALLAPPNDIIDNLWFAANGNVYACYLVAGLPYHLRSLRKRSAVADLHAILARELPADSYLYGLHVPQDQRQLLRAMVHDHRDQAAWVNSCMQMAPEIARQNPATRLYVLAVPVDSGRAGHNPVGQATKVKDWIAGRDKDSDSSLQAYQNLAYDVASSIPPQFSPLPATADMLDWFWRHNAWLGTFNEPLPRRRQQQRQPQRISGAALPQAQFDEGDQLHKPRRPALLQWLPSWKKLVRVHSPQQIYPDSYHAILPVVDAPEGGIVFPGSEFLSALDDLTGATFDFVINLTARPRELEFRRNDLAKGNVDDQFDQRGDIRNGFTELRSTARKIDEYNRLLSANIDEQPLGAAFLIHVGAADPRSLDYAVKRVKEELTQSGQIVVRHYRGAQTRLWSAFNIGTAQHRSGIDQFSHPTTATKWSRFVPLTSALLGNMTGILLGFNKSNANNSAVMLDLPGSARRNHSPLLVVSGAPGYGKSYAAKRIARAEIQKGAQGFIVDPDDYREWATALADVPNTAVIDMAGNNFGCCPLRIFPDRVAGAYWLDYMVPMLGLDPRSTAVLRLRTILTPNARRALDIVSTASLMSYINGLQATADTVDNRPPAVARLAEDLLPVLVALQSWATYEFTQGIFDDALPVPDLVNLDVTIWNTGSLDLPDAEEMNTPHLYANLSDRQRASVAIYSMLVRLARVTFFTRRYLNGRRRFGLIVLEEAGALLNSRAGARDAHLISRRARKHYTGMMIITQNPVKDLALMGAEFITQQIIVPFEDEKLAKQVAADVGLPLDEYEELAEYFLAEPPDNELGDPTAFDDFDNEGNTGSSTDRGDLEGRAFFVDEFRRSGPIQIAREPDARLHQAYDTTPDQDTQRKPAA